MAQLDFTNRAMRAEMISAMKSWVFTANVDGFRQDYADAVPADFWQQATDTLRSIGTHKLLLLAEGRRAANFTSGSTTTLALIFTDPQRRVRHGRQRGQHPQRPQ